MAREIDGKLRVANDIWGDFRLSVATDKILGISERINFGRNSSVDATPEDVWVTGGTFIYPETETTLSIVSTSSDDDAAGTGARIVRIEYLDGDFNTHIVDVELDGINPVQVATDFFRMQDAYVLTAGTGATNAGVVTLTYTGGINAGTISVGANDIQSAHYTVPAGYTAYIVGANVGAGKSSDANVFLQIKDATNGPVFRTRDEVAIVETTLSLNLPLYYEVPEKHDIRIRAVSNQGNSTVIVSYYIILRDNDLYTNN